MATVTAGTRAFDLEAFRRALEPICDELGVDVQRVQLTRTKRFTKDGASIDRKVVITGVVLDVSGLHQRALELEG